MTLTYFNQLTEGKQAYFLDNFCTHLGSVAINASYVASLYYATDFFVEILFHTEDKCIDSIDAFQSTRKLWPYLEGLT